MQTKVFVKVFSLPPQWMHVGDAENQVIASAIQKAAEAVDAQVAEFFAGITGDITIRAQSDSFPIVSGACVGIFIRTITWAGSDI